MRKKHVLFVCVHNSARSVIAEAILNQLCGDAYQAQSAGLSPTAQGVNPLAVAVLQEEGIDVSAYQPRYVFDVVKSSQIFTTGGFPTRRGKACSHPKNSRPDQAPDYARVLHAELPGRIVSPTARL